MATPNSARSKQAVTPANRLERWKKLWSTPRRLTAEEADAAFDEFADALVPRHMHKMFLRNFGVPKAQFGNRFFLDDAKYQNWDSKIGTLVGVSGDDVPVEAIVLYGSPDKLEAHALRGQRRRTLRDLVIDDWFAACAIVRLEDTTLYVWVEPKMRGCIVRSIRAERSEDEAPTLVEFEPEPILEEYDEPDRPMPGD